MQFSNLLQLLLFLYYFVPLHLVFHVSASITIVFPETGNDTVGTEQTDNKPADIGTNIEEEVVKVTDCSCQNTENSVPTVQTDALKYLAASCINQRKATALVSRNLTGVLTSKALSDLRNCLPGWYKKKYNLK